MFWCAECKQHKQLIDLEYVEDDTGYMICTDCALSDAMDLAEEDYPEVE